MRPHHLKKTKSHIFGDFNSVPRELILLLTGSPLQNSTNKLWAILIFSYSDTFESKEALVEHVGKLTDVNHVFDPHTVFITYPL